MINKNKIPQLLREQILEHALTQPAVEICGLIGGQHNQATTVYPVKNIAENSKHWFLMDPKEQISAMRSMRDNSESLWGIYHSHPDAPAIPSETDRELAAYPDTYYIIISMESALPVMQVYYFDGNNFINPCDKDDS